MTKIGGFLLLLLTVSSILSILSLIFSVWVYTYDYDSKLSGQASSQATIGVTIESSDAQCGDDLCNGAETCSTCPGDCGVCPSGGSGGSSGGGGGGGSYSSSPSFQLSEDNFNLKIVSGESQTNEVIITNNGATVLDIALSVTGIESYVYFNSNSLSINPGQSVPLRFTIDAPEPGVYAGKIILTYQGISKEVLVLLNIVSEGVLFDATVTIPDLYRVLREGQRLPVLIELLEVGGETGVDVTMNYVIQDFNGNIYYTESETFYVEGAKSYSKRFSTAGLKPGDYVLGAELVYIGGFATSTAHFRISDSLITPQTWVAIGSLVVALVVCFLAVMFFKRHSKKQIKLKKFKVK